MLTRSNKLEERELNAIAELEREVVQADGGRLKLEWGVLRNRNPEKVNDLLWWEGERLVGFCGLYAFGGPIELAGMVSSSFRRQGIGSALLDAAKGLVTELGKDKALLVTPRTTPAGPAFAAAHGGKLSHSEHYLFLGTTPPSPEKHLDVVVREGTSEDHGELDRVLSAAFGEDSSGDSASFDGDPDTRQIVIERAGRIIGGLRLSGDADRTGIYGFAIDPLLQGQGVGRSVLARVCRKLREEGTDNITLEVEVENDHALGLYTSLGFERRATEDYFEIPI
jgi:ribosomal protein S18 acetylase RimI-like enzyme